MLRIIILAALVVVQFYPVIAQEKPVAKKYWKSASEFIFSGGIVDAKGGPLGNEIDVSPLVRFSGFFHLQAQYHIDFNTHVGMYTGLGVRNVGMINKLNDSIRIKQRVYSLGIPLALKLGSLPGFFVAFGGEAELFFHYKQKVFYDDEKFKKSDWFSDKVNLVNPSVFLDITSAKGAYIRFKYYLLDFLVENKQDVDLSFTSYDYRPQSSKMFYISFGTTMKALSPRKAKKATQSTNTTLLY